jgi:hypothetical protein
MSLLEEERRQRKATLEPEGQSDYTYKQTAPTAGLLYTQSGYSQYQQQPATSPIYPQDYRGTSLPQSPVPQMSGSNYSFFPNQQPPNSFPTSGSNYSYYNPQQGPPQTPGQNYGYIPFQLQQPPFQPPGQNYGYQQQSAAPQTSGQSDSYSYSISATQSQVPRSFDEGEEDEEEEEEEQEEVADTSPSYLNQQVPPAEVSQSSTRSLGNTSKHKDSKKSKGKRRHYS